MTIRRVRTVFSGVAGSPWYSNLYFDADGVTPSAQQNVDAVDAFWTALASLMDNAVTWTIGPEVPELDETTGELTGVQTVTPGTGAGTDTTDPLPYMSQGLVRLSTTDFVAGRRVRGRIFVPGLTETANTTTGQPSGSAITAMTTAGTNLVAAGGLLVWSRPFAGDPAATPPRPARAGSKASITAVSGWNQWAVMRSRRD